MERGRTRRELLIAAAAIGGFASCNRPPVRSSREVQLTFYTWGEPVELDAFQGVIVAYERTRPDVKVHLEEISYKSRSEIDTLLAAGIGPDLFRVPYLEVGRYSVSGACLDLSTYLKPEIRAAFDPAVWTAVTYRGKPHALPHHMDTSAIVYNRTIFNRLGIQAPGSLQTAWTWSEFIDIARKLKRNACEFAFAVNWTYGGAFRWLNFLHQHGGALLDDSLAHCQIDNEAAQETVRWTQSFFDDGLVPPSDSAQANEQVENLFATGVVGMYFDVGPQSLRQLDPHFEWAATFLPRDKHFGSELGGNAIAVTRDSKHPELAADFACFVTNEENMRRFTTQAQFLPVRTKLMKEGLDYPYRPDQMRVHLEQSTAIPLELARTITAPEFFHVNRILGDELDAAFTGKQAADVTVRHIQRDVQRLLDERT
jgi:multiple sugar transport system substrate-binding protein